MWLFTGNVRLETARPYARPRACPYVRVYIYCVSSSPLLFSFKKSCSVTCLSISHLWKSFDISDKKGLVYLVRIPKSATFASAFENGGGDSLTFWQKRSRNPFLFSCYLVLFVSWIPPLKRKMKKNFRFIWSIWNKVLTFAPAFKMRAALFDNLFEIRAVTTVFFFVLPFAREMTWRKKKIKKTFENIWKVLNKVLTFASAFEKKSNRKTSDLWTDLHKQYK